MEIKLNWNFRASWEISPSNFFNIEHMSVPSAYNLTIVIKFRRIQYFKYFCSNALCTQWFSLGISRSLVYFVTSTCKLTFRNYFLFIKKKAANSTTLLKKDLEISRPLYIFPYTVLKVSIFTKKIPIHVFK